MVGIKHSQCKCTSRRKRDTTHCLVATAYGSSQAFDDSKAAGRIANMGLEKLGAIGAGLGDKLNENADKALNKARAMDVSA